MYLSMHLSFKLKKIAQYLFLFCLWTAVVSHRSGVARPKEVRFNSVNLKNVVHWRHGKDSPKDSHYTVEYAIYGDGNRKTNWRVKKECVVIPQTWCDLSNETTVLYENYYARVKAVVNNIASNWTRTKRFDPKSHTTLGRPLVKLKMEGNCVSVKLKGPMRWKTGNLTREYSMLKYFPDMKYTVFVNESRSNTMQPITLDTKSFKYCLLTYETQYCFSAMAQSLSLDNEASNWQCITTPKDPFYDQLLLMVIGVAVPSVFCLFALLLVGCLVYHFVYANKQPSPSFLQISNIPKPPQTFCPERAVTVNVILGHVAMKHTVPDVIYQPEMKPLLSYAPQPALDRAGSQEEPWERDLREVRPETPDYGFVGAEMPEIRETKASNIEESLPLGPGQLNMYVAQGCAARPLEPLDNMFSPGICVDRDPGTGLFRIPLTHLRVQGKGYITPDQGPYAPQCLSIRETPEWDLWEGKAEDLQMHPSDSGPAGSIPKQQVETTEYLAPSDGRVSQPLQTAQVNPHRSQRHIPSPEESEEEEEGGNCVDWSPTTGVLQMPLLSRIILQAEADGEMEPDRESEAMEILPSVMVRQSSQESEGESDLTKLQNVWNLQIGDN